MNKFRYIFLLISTLFCNFIYGQKFPDEYWLDKYYSVSYPLHSIKINSLYGIRRDPINGRARHHFGLDLQARYEEVLAMFDGYVKRVANDPTSGNYIIMQFGDYTISYCHLSQIWVKSGTKIYAGDPVGVTDNSGRTSGPHLHITAKLKGKLTDPLDLLRYIKDTKDLAIRSLHKEERELLSPQEFIKKYAPLAINQQRKYGIPSSVILAQMCIESTFGTSNLALAGHNFFGIKASPKWIQSGLPYSYHDDDRKDEKFCNYRSPEESIEAHSRLLLSDRYRHCFRYSSTDYHNWLVAIKAAGYATAKNYVAKCEKIIKQYKLYRYDIVAQRT